MVTVNGSKNGAKTEKRGGFKVPDKTAMVRFEGTDYDGAEILLRLNVSLSHYLKLRELAEVSDQAGMANLFGDHMLSSWNLEDENGLIEASGKGMMDLPMEFATLIIGQWGDPVANGPAPLDQPSADLSMLAEASTAMEDE